MQSALVGDIGGTNARLALASFDGDTVRIDAVKVYPTHEHGALEEVITDYLQSHAGERPQAVCVAAAGPVTDGAVTMTNLGWRISEKGLAGLGFSQAKVINDFTAQAYGIEQLGPGDVEPIGEGRPGDPRAPAAIVGAGTGFGAAALFRGDGASVAVPGEGGHIGFAPNDAEEVAIHQWLATRFGHVSVERLLSGPGLVNLYQALGEIDGVATPLATPEKIGDEAGRGDPLATRAVQRFCSVYGSVAGDFALVYGAKGGLYLAGGLAPHLHAFLHHGRFREAFEAKGRYRDYLRAVPTAIVLDTFIALKGAGAALRQPTVSKAPRMSHARKHADYKSDLEMLQLALVRTQAHAIKKGHRAVVVMEGRDGAGKDGAIARITKHLSSRATRVVSLPKPTDRQASQWWFQRYVEQLPSAGELVIFNRSWYNRAGVEVVMKFSTPAEQAQFLRDAPLFEQMLVESGITLVKYYLDISEGEEAKRLEARQDDPIKQLKTSDMDKVALDKWSAYSAARDEMLTRTSTPWAPWTCICTDDKKTARLNIMAHLLHALAPKDIAKDVQEPDPKVAFTFEKAAIEDGRLSR